MFIYAVIFRKNSFQLIAANQFSSLSHSSQNLPLWDHLSSQDSVERTAFKYFCLHWQKASHAMPTQVICTHKLGFY